MLISAMQKPGMNSLSYPNCRSISSSRHCCSLCSWTSGRGSVGWELPRICHSHWSHCISMSPRCLGPNIGLLALSSISRVMWALAAASEIPEWLCSWGPLLKDSPHCWTVAAQDLLALWMEHLHGITFLPTLALM